MSSETAVREREQEEQNRATGEIVEGVVQGEEIATKPRELPASVVRRGINEGQWRMLFNLYPGARPESALMVWDYCQARRLDPMKKPCHIVPMDVKDANGNWTKRDVVMPGIYEYRITAHRTGTYLGHSKPTYGPVEDIAGVKAPASCEMTFFRWHAEAQRTIEFPVEVFFSEVVATNRDGKANSRWTKAPRQMLTKCTEAAGLREGWPEEFGGEPTAEEMEGREILEPAEVRVEPLREPVRRSAKVDTVAETTATATTPTSPINQVQSEPPAGNGAQKPAGTGKAAAPSTEKPPKAEEFKQAGPGQVLRNVRITNTAVVDNTKRGGGIHYEIEGDTGEAGKVNVTQTWVTKSDELYSAAASCEGHDARFVVTFHNAKSKDGKKDIKVITGLEGN